LLAASNEGCFEVVLIDDLSRLARDNYLMLTKLAQLHFNGVSVVSVADGLNTEDRDSKLAIQIRGIFNELQLEDLRKKTLRGQKGQKERGFFVGESTYGYRSVPFGEIRMDKKGRPRPEGYKMEIEPSEAAIVLRIFQEFAEGRSKSEIVRRLNAEGVPGRFKSARGWSPSTITRILKNTKYIGKWIWNKTESRKDPKTGRLRRFPKPESEWHIHEDENLRIIPQNLWDKVQKRLEKTRRTWPGGKSRRGFEGQNGSRVTHYPSELLSGAMVCAVCGGAIGKRSGKTGGYYGCINAGKGACDNKLIVRRTVAERVIISALWDELANTENLAYVLKRVEEKVEEMHAEVPETIRLKEVELNAERRRVDNFVAYIAEGRSSDAVSKALEAVERRVEQLTTELSTLKASKDRIFKAPPPEWIEDRIGTIQEILERRVGKSALILRKLLGKIRLEPVKPDIGKPYLRAVSKLQALALFEIKPGSEETEPGNKIEPDKGSNSLRWWRRRELNPRPKILPYRRLRA
jgi:site-specific DNA recombinase